MKTLAKKIHKLTKGGNHEEVYQLLCRLAGTVGKLYDDEEQEIMLIDDCMRWQEDKKCFIGYK